MGSFGVVMVSPSFDNNLGFPQRVEYLSVEQFISHSPLKLSQYPFSQGDPAHYCASSIVVLDEDLFRWGRFVKAGHICWNLMKGLLVDTKYCSLRAKP